MKIFLPVMDLRAFPTLQLHVYYVVTRFSVYFRMSSRTKLIMDMVKQQASNSSVDIVEFVVGEDGILSTIGTELSTGINQTPPKNNIEILSPNILTSLDGLEYPIDLNDAVNNELENPQISETKQDDIVNFDVSFVPVDDDFASDINKTLLNNVAVSQPNILTNFDHVELPIDLNDAISVNNEIENPRNTEMVQDIDDDVASNITDISYEHDDLDAPYVSEGSDFDNSFTNKYNKNSEERSVSPFDSSLNNTKTRRKRKLSERWNYNTNKYKRLRGQPYQGKKGIGGSWNYSINKPGYYSVSW